jgi:nucleotide-binding universal stress UspA family protein
MTEPVILVPLDDSKQALSALPVAKVLGEIERATLHILHVSEHKLTAEELHSRLGREAPALDGFTIEARIGMPEVQILQVAKETNRERSSFASTVAPSEARCWAARQ